MLAYHRWYSTLPLYALEIAIEPLDFGETLKLKKVANFIHFERTFCKFSKPLQPQVCMQGYLGWYSYITGLPLSGKVSGKNYIFQGQGNDREKVFVGPLLRKIYVEQLLQIMYNDVLSA